MMEALVREVTGGAPAQLRDELRRGDSPDLGRRRGIVVASLAGMAGMAAVTLLQTGVVKHLPDPPLRGFHSDQVNSGETAWQFGVPDGPLGLLSFATNLPLAAAGGAERARTAPWIPLAAAGKAAIEAVWASYYFSRMPRKEKAWCAYCIATAAASLTVFGLALPEAVTAWRGLRRAGR